MTRAEFEDLVARLKDGDNSALAYLYSYQDDCIRRMVVKSAGKCDQDVSYDIFIDAILDFRRNILRDRVKFQNIPAYLFRICWNKWLEENRRQIKVHLTHKSAMAQMDVQMQDPMQKATTDEIQKERLQTIHHGMAKLSEQCRRILYMAISDGLSMVEIAGHLNMASSDVAKTTKSRCYKKLIEHIRKGNLK